MKKQTIPSILGGLVLVLLVTPETTAQQWSTFHGDAQRSGHTSIQGPVTPRLLWKSDLGGPILSSPVIGADGTIYLGSVLRKSKRPRHFITAVHPDGTIKWRFPTGFYDEQTPSSPTVAPDGTVYVGAQDGAFYAFDPNGTPRWKYQGREPVRQHPVVTLDGSRIYVGIDGELTAFDSTGQVLWRYDLQYNVSGGPSLAEDGTIYAVSLSGVVAIHPDGTLKWQSSVTGSLAPPAVAPNGNVIVASQHITALNPNTGGVRWSHSDWWVGSFGPPCIDVDNNVYYGSDAHIWKIGPDGQEIWDRLMVDNGAGLQTQAPILLDGRNNMIFGLGVGRRFADEGERNIFVYDSDGTRVGSFLLGDIAGTSGAALSDDGTKNQ